MDTTESALAERLKNASTSRFAVQSVSSHPVEVLCDDYPFTQTVYQGVLLYDEPSEYTPGREIKIDFEYRDGSGLFILELNTDVGSVDELAQAVSDAIPEQFTVYRNLHVPEDALWEFLSQADSVIDIRVLAEGSEVSYDEIEDVDPSKVIGNYAIESAEVGFVIEGHNIVVKYHQGDLQIETSWVDGQEYIIQLFERDVLAGA
ncbi:hypothetical protein ACOJIV_02735 [Haloarcula sp. AONF1]